MVPEVSSRLLRAGKDASLSLLRHLHSSCPLDSLPGFWKESLTFPTDSASRRWDGRALSPLSLPTVRVAVPGSGSSAVALCAVAERRGRKDLVWERGKAACEPALLATSLSEQAQTRRRTLGGARRADPRGGHRAEEAAQGPVWALRAARRAEQGGWTRFCAPGGSGVQGCHWPGTETPVDLPMGQPGLRGGGPRGRGGSWRCLSGTWTPL